MLFLSCCVFFLFGWLVAGFSLPSDFRASRAALSPAKAQEVTREIQEFRRLFPKVVSEKKKQYKKKR